MLVVVTAVAVLALWDRRDPALEIGDWSYSRAELEADLEAISGNQAYRQVRERQGRPLPAATDDGYDVDLVAEVLTDRATFRLAEVALAERGGEVSGADVEAATRTLLGVLVDTEGPLLTGGPEATMDSVLEEFGPWRDTLVEGVAAVEALRRVVVAEAVADGADIAEVDEGALVLAALQAAAEAEGVRVADDLGTWDPARVTVVAVGASAGGLTPLTPEGPATGDTAPAGPVLPTTTAPAGPVLPTTTAPAGAEGPVLPPTTTAAPAPGGGP